MGSLKISALQIAFSRSATPLLLMMAFCVYSGISGQRYPDNSDAVVMDPRRRIWPPRRSTRLPVRRDIGLVSG